MIKYLMRDMSGTLVYIPYGIAAGVLLYIIVTVIKKRKGSLDERVKPMWRLLFYIYVAILLIITFWSREGGTLKEIDLQIGSSWGINNRNNAYVIENVLLFMPYGFLLEAVWRKNWFCHFFVGFLSSLVIECLQLVTGRGIFQIDDILTNTLGAVLGYIILRMLYKVKR